VNDDHRAAFDSLRAAVRIARYAGDCSALIGRLVEIGCRQSVYRNYVAILVDAFAQEELPPCYVSFILEDPPIGDLKDAFVFDARIQRQVLNEVFGRRDLRDPPKVDTERLKDLYGDSVVGTDGLLTRDQLPVDIDALEYEYSLAAIQRITDSQRGGDLLTFREIEAMGQRLDKDRADPRVFPVIPNSSRVFALRRRLQLQRDGAIITTAIYSYRHCHGEWPDSIDAALREFPAQPACRNYYGHDFVYRVTDNKPILYVVGPNETDDGGDGHLVYRRRESGTGGDDVLILE
jgi:hypothetical protein